MSLKVTDVLNQFNGDGDVSVWLKQAHLAKHLLKLKDLAVVIPLFLDGPAIAVYDQLKEEEKRDADKIELALRTDFACGKFLAYDEFRNRQWKNVESVDVYCIWMILSGWPIWQTSTVKMKKLLNFRLLWGYLIKFLPN